MSIFICTDYRGFKTMDPEKLVEQLINELRKDSKNLSEIVKRELSKVKGLRDFTKFESELKKSTKTLKENNDLNDDQIDQIEKLLDKRRDLLASEDKLSKAFGRTFQQLGVGASKAAIWGENTATASEFIKRFSDAAYKGTGKLSDLGSALEVFGPLGQRLNALLGRIDTNVDAFRTLAQTGASFGQSIIALRNAASSAGLPLVDFVNLVADGRETLAAFFGSTSAGALEFGRLANEFRRTNREALAPLGFTVDEINDVLLTNLNLARRTGMFERETVNSNIQSSRVLALEMDRLAKLTGQQRSTLTKQIEAGLSNEKFLARLNEVTPEVRRSLSLFQASISDLAPELATGLQDLIANSGVPVTAAAMELAQNVPQLGDIIRQLESGSINTEQALIAFRNIAKDASISLAGVAKTGTVEFTRLYGGINKVASLELDRLKVLEEQNKSEAFTKATTQFEDASKRLAGMTQSFETAFFDAMAPIIGGGANTLNASLDGLSGVIKGMPDGLKATLFGFGQVLGGIVDFAKQQGAIVGAVATGTFLGNIKANGLGGALGSIGKTAGRVGGIGAGLTGLTASYQLAKTGQTAGEKALGIAGGAASGALTGAMIGSMVPVIGTAVGAIVGGIIGASTSAYGAAARDTGTLGETGFYAETMNRRVNVEKGERVLSPGETQEYQASVTGAAALENAIASLNTQMGSVNSNLDKLYAVGRDSVNRLNTLVNLSAIGNENTSKTNKRLAETSSNMLT